jgi:glycosyltransferase involved in cell wall biosynthesis
MLRVLMVDHFLPESIYTLELGNELKKRVELRVVTNRKFSPPAGLGFGVTPLFASEYRRMGKLKAALKYAWGLMVLALMIIFGCWDVVHVQTFKRMEAETRLYRLLKPFMKRLVYTAHNIASHEENVREHAVMKGFFGVCDLIMVHNEYSRQELLAQYPGVKASAVAVIPHGVYNRYYREMGELPVKADGKTRFVFFGGIRQYKGVDILLRAISLLPEETRARCSFIIAGSQLPHLDDTDYVAMAAGLGIEKDVDFRIRYIDDDELRKIMGEADCCVLPYRSIYGSGTLLMAYSFGVISISSDLDAFREETDGGKTGLLFAAEHPEALAEAIERFLNLNAEEIETYRRGIESMRTGRHSWALSAEKLARCYQNGTLGL